MKRQFRVPQGKYSYLEREIKPVKVWRSLTFLSIIIGIVFLTLADRFSDTKILDMAEYHAGDMLYRVAIEEYSAKKRWTSEDKRKNFSHEFVLGKYLVLYQKSASEKDFKEVNRFLMEEVGPWCIDIGQMDEHPDLEIFIGAFRGTRYYAEGTRAFFFTWNPEKNMLTRLWTGSYLDAEVFYQAEFEDCNGDGLEEICLLEKDWQGGLEKNYCTYYSYDRKQFTPYKVKRIPLDTQETKKK